MSEIPIEINHISGLLVNALLLMAVEFGGQASQNSGLLQGNSISRKQSQIFSIFTRRVFGLFCLRVGSSPFHLHDCQERNLPGRNS
jgi:hypothetical protein